MIKDLIYTIVVMILIALIIEIDMNLTAINNNIKEIKQIQAMMIGI